MVRVRPRLGAAVIGLLLDAASHGPAGLWTLLIPARLGSPACPPRLPVRRFSAGGTTVMPVGLSPGRAARAGSIENFNNGTNARRRLMHLAQPSLTTLIIWFNSESSQVHSCQAD